MVRLVQVNNEAHLAAVRGLCEEFIHWSNQRAEPELGISIEVESTLDRLMEGIKVRIPKFGLPVNLCELADEVIVV